MTLDERLRLEVEVSRGQFGFMPRIRITNHRDKWQKSIEKNRKNSIWYL